MFWKEQETRHKKKDKRNGIKGNMIEGNTHNDLGERLFNFSVAVILFLKKLDNQEPNWLFKYQLGKSATSSGANYEESQAGISKADFLNKVRIALKEMRESNYWLRLIKTTNTEVQIIDELNKLIIESSELKKILGSIVNKMK